MFSEQYKKIKDLMFRFQSLGIIYNEPTGAIMIGKAPHIAPMANLNRIYNQIDDEGIRFIEQETKLTIPSAYRHFLTHFSNGLAVLNMSISLFGLRMNYIRNREYIWQPFDIIQFNRIEKPRRAPKGAFFIGLCGYNLMALFMMPDDERVYMCDVKDDNAVVLKQWPTFADMVISEIERLYTLVDDHGRFMVSDKEIIPPFD